MKKKKKGEKGKKSGGAHSVRHLVEDEREAEERKKA